MKNTLGAWFQEYLADRGVAAPYVPLHHPAQVPCLHIELAQWRDTARFANEERLRFVALWAAEEAAGFSIYAAFAHRYQGYTLLRTLCGNAPGRFPSIAMHFVAAARMERVVQDLYGFVADDHPDRRPWLKHEHWPADAYPLRKSFCGERELSYHDDRRYPFIEADGEGVYEIPVGPVHAGIIEPGHFRFLAVGEQILNLEQRLGYAHKGIEKRMEGRDVHGGARLAARISGDATVAHGWAYAQAVEAAAGVEVPLRATALRALMCERERMANHIGDIGAVCNDAAWSFMHMQCQRLREDLARLHLRLFGHRLMMDRIVPGGVRVDVDPEGIAALRAQTRAVTAELREFYAMYENHTSIRDRVVDSGNVSAADAADIGLLGYAGRSVSVDVDVRRDLAYAPYDRLGVRVALCTGGDVAARLWVRFEEAFESARLIDALLEDLPGGDVRVDFIVPEPRVCGLGLVESWRGEILSWVRFGAGGLIDRYYVRDPSVINWLGLELAVRTVPVPDFPLNNKSFNCSYSGNDL